MCGARHKFTSNFTDYWRTPCSAGLNHVIINTPSFKSLYKPPQKPYKQRFTVHPRLHLPYRYPSISRHSSMDSCYNYTVMVADAAVNWAPYISILPFPVSPLPISPPQAQPNSFKTLRTGNSKARFVWLSR